MRVTVNGNTIVLPDSLDPHYGQCLWPSSLVLSHFLARFHQDLCGEGMWISKVRVCANHVLELGCGKGLPSLVLKSFEPCHVVLTDLAEPPSVLQGVHQAMSMNSMHLSCFPLDWNGSISTIQQQSQHILSTFPSESPLLIMASDIFYDPSESQAILSLIDTLLSMAHPESVFLTAYQERSSKRSISHLLDIFSLSCVKIPHELYVLEEHNVWIEKTETMAQSAIDIPGIDSVTLFLFKKL
jgi:predicted nicotinamide N-methyase